MPEKFTGREEPGQVGMAVDQPRNEGRPGGIDHLGLRSDGVADILAHAGDPGAAGAHGLAVQDLACVNVDQPGIHDGQIARRTSEGDVDQFGITLHGAHISHIRPFGNCDGFVKSPI